MTFRDYRLLQRIWHQATGDYFDVMSERFDRHADTSKNIRDVSEPETALLLHTRMHTHIHTKTQSVLGASALICPLSVNVTQLFMQL